MELPHQALRNRRGGAMDRSRAARLGDALPLDAGCATFPRLRPPFLPLPRDAVERGIPARHAPARLTHSPTDELVR
jgi:hypothetical protein